MWLIACALITLVAGFCVYIFLIEPKRYTLNTATLEIPRTPSHGSAKPVRLTVLHLSDFHFLREDARKLAFVKGLSGYQVDFVLVTGDLIENEGGIDTCIDALQAFSPRYGTYAVLGGHDYYEYQLLDIVKDFTIGGRNISVPNPVHKLVARLRESAVTILINENRTFDCLPGRISIIGLDDPYFERDDLGQALRSLPDDTLRILLTHTIDDMEALAAAGIDVVLSGHTHGGQVRVPLVGALLTRSNLHPRYASGVFRVGDCTFHISRGIGSGRWTNFRFLSPPEANLVEILKQG